MYHLDLLDFHVNIKLRTRCRKLIKAKIEKVTNRLEYTRNKNKLSIISSGRGLV